MALVGSGNIRPAIWSPKGQQAEHPNKGYKSVRFKPGLTSSPTDFNGDGVPTVKSTSGEATIGRTPQNTDYPPFPVPNIIVSGSSENTAPSAADRVWRPKTPDQFQERQQPGNFPVSKFSVQSHTDGIKRPGSAGNQSIYDTPPMNAGINQNKINQNQPNFQAAQFDGNKNFSNTNQNFQTSRLPIGPNNLQREGPNFTNQQGFNRGQQFQQHVNNQQPQQMQQFSHQQQQQFNKLPQQQNFNNQSHLQFSQQPQQQNFHNQSQQQFNQQPQQRSFNNQSLQQNLVQNNGLRHQQNFNHQQHNPPHQLPNSNQQPFYNHQNQQKQTSMQHGQAGQMQHQQTHPLPQQQHQQQNLMHQQQQPHQQQQQHNQQQYQQDEADNEASGPFQMAKLQAKFEKFQSGKTETNRPSSAGKQNLFQNDNRLALDKPSTQSHENFDVRNGQEVPVAGQVTVVQEVKSTARWNPVRSVVDSSSDGGQGKVKLGRPPDSHQDEKLQSEEWWNAFMQDPNQIQPPQVDMERVITSATRQQNIISPGSHGSHRLGEGERKGEVLQEWRSGLYDDRPSGRSSVDLYEQLKNTYKHSNSSGGRGPGVKRQISEPFPRGSFPDQGESFRIDQITSKSTQPGRALPPVVKPDSIQRNPVKLEAIVREEPEQKNGFGTLNRPSFSRGISEPAPSLTGPTRSGPLTDPSRSGQTMPAILSPNSTLRNETIRTQNKFSQPDEGRSVGPNISWNRAEVGKIQNGSPGQSGVQRDQGPAGGGTERWNPGKVDQNWPANENMFEGIEPMDTLTGIPLLPGNSIQDRSKREWYKKMYDAIHKSEPTQDDLDREASPLLWDLKHDSNKSNSSNQTQPRQSSQQYRNQPMRIEDYQPGHSSLTLQNDKRKAAAARSRNVYAESDTEANYGRDYPTDLLLSPTYSDTGDVNRFQKYGRAKGSRYATINTDKVSRQMTPDDFKQKRRDEIERVMDEERLRRFKEEQKMNQSRRHTDTLTPMQKSSILLNRFDEDFQDNLERPVMKCPTRIRGKAKALYTFRAQNNRELSFKRGDPIYILKQIDKNWLKGELHGVQGIFPANYVEVTVSLDDARSAALEKEGQAVVNYNFAAQSPAELSLRKGDIVQLIKRIDENWYEGRVGNRQGIFPVSYVECNREPNTPLMTPMSSHAPTPLPGTPGRLSPTSTNSIVGPDVPSAPISPWAWDTDFYESEFETGNSRARTPVNVDVGLSSTSDHSGNSPQPYKDQKIYTSGPDQPLLTVSGPPQSRFTPSSDQRGVNRPDLTRSQSLTNPPKHLTSLPDDTMSLDDLEDFLKSLAQDRSVTPIHVDTNPAPESDVRSNLAARVVDHKPPIRPSTLQGGRELKKGTGSSGSSPGTLSGRPPSGVRSEKKMQLGGPSGEGKGSGRSTPTPKEIGSFIRATNDAQFLFSKPTNGINYPRYRALYDYNPTNQDELELRIGEVVNVMEKCDDGWYVGVSEKTNKFGTFPGNYVRPI